MDKFMVYYCFMDFSGRRGISSINILINQMCSTDESMCEQGDFDRLYSYNGFLTEC